MAWKVTAYTGKRRDKILGSTYVRADTEDKAKEIGRKALRLIGIKGKYQVSAAVYRPENDWAFFGYLARVEVIVHRVAGVVVWRDYLEEKMSESSIGIQLLHPFCFTNPGKWSDGFNEHGIFEIVGLDELSGRVPKATIRRIASFKADCMIGEVAKTPTHRIKSRAVRTSLHSFSEHADFNQLTAAQSRVAELEKLLRIVNVQLGNIEFNIRQESVANPSKEDWLRIVRSVLEQLNGK